VLHPRDDGFAELNARFPASVGVRQVYDVTLEMVQSSCGYAVPHFDYAGERDTLAEWTERKGPDGIRAYWDERNRVTIDGMPTGVLPE
jgi:hypothetical protein